MADIQSNIVVNIDTSAALAELKALQRQISAFHSTMAKGGAASAAVSANMQQNLANTINSSGKFHAEMVRVRSTTESFNTALAKNQLSMKEYFRYAGAASKTFGRLFKQEHETINKVARENVKTLQTQYIKMGRDASGSLKAMSVRPLTLDMKNLQTQVAIAAQKQALLNQLLRQGSTNLLNFGKNTQWAGRQLMVGFTVPLMYFGAAAGKVFMQLEEQAIKFKRVYGDLFTTSSEAAAALKDVQLLANEFTKYGIAVADTMKMAADVAATGKVGADLMSQVASATKLAILGNIDQEKSLETIISLTSTFGIASNDLAKNIDFLNAVENQTLLNIDDLTTAIPKAAPVIQQLGGDVQDLAFFMAAMKEGGINASEGANALKSGLASMINPSAKASAFLADLGINLKGIVEANQGDVKSTVINFAQALDTLDPLNRARAIEQLFGKFQFARISTLFQNVVKEGTQAQTVLGLTKATTEELAILSERELAKVSDSPMFKFKKQIEDLKVAIAPIGGEFLKALTPVIKFFGGIFERFNDLSEGAKKFVVIFTTVVAGIGPILLMSFGLLANGVANIIKMFVGIKSIFNGVGKSSLGLGEQTNYLTQQQMENAAVAASLDQVHQRLQQRFTSEKNAVVQLTAAYLQAVQAQKAFSMVPMRPGMPGKPPMRLAEGIVTVPGPKGAGDVVPAMLSPGESVIPAKQSEKYAPLIAGMIADNIPGYIKGKQGKTEFAHIGSMTPVPAATLAAQLNQMEGAVTARALRVINAVAAQFGNALMVNVYGKLGMTTGQTSTGKSINGLLGKPGGVAKSEFVADFDKQGMQRWKASLKAAGLKMDDVSAELTQLDRGIREYMVSVHKGATVTDQTVKQAYEYSTKKMAADSRVVAAFNQLANTAGEARVNISQAVAAKFGLSKVPTAGSKPVVRVGEERIRTGGDRLPFYRSAGFDIVKAATRAIAEGAKSALKVASPSKEMRTVGEQSGAGLVLGAKGQIDDATVAGQQIGAAIKSGAVSGPMPTGSQSRNRAALYGTGPVDADAKSIRRQLEAVEKRKLAEAKKQLKLDEKISQSKQKLYGTTGEITQEMRAQRRLQQSAERALVKATAERAKAEQKEAANVIKQSSLTAAMERLKLRAIKSRTDSELMAARKAKMSQVGGKIGGAAMGLSMVTMMGSMAPGAVGEMFQKAMMPLMLLSMAATLAGSSLGLLALGIGVVIGAYVMNRMAVDKAGDAAIAFADRVNGSNQALQVFAEAAGKVTASEVMDRRRKDEVKQYQTVTGKTTFGESFVEGEKGKALVKDVGANIAQRGSAGASTALFRQLAMGVTSGAMSTEQARSIALNVGDALGNQAFGIQVNAKLTELLGPNGENFIKDPLTIRTKMVDATNRDLAASNTRAQKTFGYRGRDVGNLAKNIGGGALAGAGVGAIAGQMLIPIPGVGAAIGAGAGALIGGVAGYFNGRKDRGKRIAASTGADAAMQKIALEEQQQMLDGLELEYQKKIDIAKAAGDSVKALELENKFLDDKQKLLDKQKITTDTIMTNFKSADKGIQEAYMNSADKLMTKKYKGTAVEDVVPMAKQAIEDSAGTQEQKYLLKMEVASGNIDPVTLISLMDLASTNKAAFDSTMNIITKFGGKAASEAQQVADLFIGADGKPNTQLQTDFMLKVSEAKTTKEAQKIIDFNAQIARTGGELDVAYLIKYYNENPEAAKIAQDLFDKVKTGNLDYEVMVRTKFMPEEYLGAIDQEYYKGLSENQKQVYMNEIVTIMSIQDETVFKGDPDVQKWLSEPASKGGGEMYQNASFPVQKAMYAAHLAGIKTAAMDATTPYKGPGDGGGDKKGPDASPLDELIKKIRDLRKAQQGLTVGWGSSMKAMNALFTDSKGKVRNLVPGKDSKGKPLDPFNGLENNLRKKGMGQGAIDFLTGLSVEDYKKIGPKFIEIDKKTGAIRVKNAAQLNALLNNIAVGNFQNENEKFITNIKNQNSAVNKLMAAGMSLEDAYAAVEDSQFAAAIATGNFTTAQVKQMAATKNNSTALLEQQEQLKSVRTYFESLTKAVTDQKVFSGLAKDLARMGMDSSMIATVLSDPTLAKGLADQLKSGKKSAEDIAAAVKKIKDTQTEKAITSINSGDMSAAFQPGYDAAQKLFDIQERMLDKQYRAIFAADEARIVSAEALVTAKQKEIDAQEKNVEIAEKGVEAANKLIAVQNERNDKLSHDLKLMDKSAQSINEKYDKQKAALDKISSINSVIANQQKKQMSLADALTQGDISAAAQAAQELREQQASDAIAEQSKAIDSVRELELSRLVNDEGKTRLQIEEEQYVISEKIYSIQQNELKTAQASVDAANAILKAKQDQLIPLQQGVTDAQAALKASQDALEAEKQKLTVLGKTKLEWEDMKLRVDAAQLANDKLMAGQLAAALATADIVDKTWKEINSKLADYFKKDGTSITIKEIHEIYQVIMGATGGSNGGTPPPAPAPVNAGNIDEVNKKVQDAQKKLITDITTAGTSDVNISEVANNMASSLIANTEATAALGGIAGVLSSARYTGQALVWAAQQAAEAKALKDAEEAAARLAATKALMSGGADAAYDRRTGYSRYAMGGMVGSYLASGGFGMKPIGTDIIPAMLTPGEFVVTKYGVENYGVDNLRAINAGSKTSDSNSVYNYSLTVNAKSDASPDDIARTVISQIKQIEGQRIRGNRL